MVKELRTIERELLADRQKAELAAAAPLMAFAAVANEAPAESMALTEPDTTGVDASKSPA